VTLTRVRSLELADDHSLSLCSGARYAAALATTRAGAVLLPATMAEAAGPSTRIIVSDVGRAMLTATQALHPESSPMPGVAATARLGAGVRLGPDCSIGEYAIVGDGAQLGARVQLGAHAVIGDGVELGDDVRLDAHVVVYSGSRLGQRVRCKSGTVIGGPGFGYVAGPTGHVRIPHVGACILEDDVDVGSNTTIDRGSLDDTRIGRGTRIDNQVQIAHNVRIGRDCLIMACVGIAGSTRLGDRVVLAGQTGCVDHITLGDDVKVGAKSAVLADVPAGTTVTGYPARPHREFLRAIATMYRLGPYGRVLESLARGHKHD
jgi:UDP-3-O-[3-hydroxymyristoyl] glucosamine N-acyltransferase